MALAVDLQLFKVKFVLFSSKMMESRFWHNPRFATFLIQTAIINMFIQWLTAIVVDKKCSMSVNQMVQEDSTWSAILHFILAFLSLSAMCLVARIKTEKIPSFLMTSKL